MTGVLLRASVLAPVATAISTNATAAGFAFDGAWSVTAVTQQGGCDPTYNFSVQIAAGLITLPGFAGLRAMSRTAAVRRRSRPPARS
jgi:hypothetical protein